MASKILQGLLGLFGSSRDLKKRGPVICRTVRPVDQVQEVTVVTVVPSGELT